MTAYSLITSRSDRARTVVGSISAAIVTLTLFAGLAALFAGAAAGHPARTVADPVPQHCTAARDGSAGPS